MVGSFVPGILKAKKKTQSHKYVIAGFMFLRGNIQLQRLQGMTFVYVYLTGVPIELKIGVVENLPVFYDGGMIQLVKFYVLVCARMYLNQEKNTIEVQDW